MQTRTTSIRQHIASMGRRLGLPGGPDLMVVHLPVGIDPTAVEDPTEQTSSTVSCSGYMVAVG